MAPKKSKTKETETEVAARPERVASVSQMPKGTGSRRVQTRHITVYGPFKSRKTTALRNLPMGRTKWIASDSNCFSADTEFITSEGVKSFKDFVPYDIVHVRTHTGKWQRAVVKEYDKRPLTQLVVGRGPNKQVIHTTDNHRWLMEDGEVKTTAELHEGDKLLKPPTPLRDWSFDEASAEQKTAWLSGFVWGDGSVSKAHGKEIGSKLRLCGEKVKFLARIESLGFTATYPDSAEGEPCLYFAQLLKRLPAADTSVELLTAFVRGYLDADGTHNMRGDTVNPFVGIQATGEESINFIRTMFPVVGAYISSERDCSDEVTNYGPRTDITVRFQLLMGFSSSPVSSYIVREVTPSAVPPEAVWCLEVENDHSFVMPSGVVTGNCIPTLAALDRLPHEDDIYEVNSLEKLREFLEGTLKLAEDAVAMSEDPRKVLGIDFLVLDSWTQFFDWHQQDTAKSTGQRYMGDNDKNNGWQQFNAEFGACLDLFSALSRYVTCIGIVHAKAKFDSKKGQYASFQLSPEMANKLGRLSNWILLKSFDEVIDPAKREEALGNPDDPYYEITDANGEKTVYEDLFYTQPVNGYAASINSLKFKQQEPGKDITMLLEKDGLL